MENHKIYCVVPLKIEEKLLWMSVIVFNQNPCKIFLIAHNFSAAVEASLAIDFSYKTNNEE